MLRTLLRPLLTLLFLSSVGYYTVASRAAVPATLPPATLQPSSAPGPAPSAVPQPLPQPQPQARLRDVDAMLVIDNSGSMFGYTCRTRRTVVANDQEQLRIEGAEIIIRALAADLRPRETKIGIVTFGDQARLVRPLTQLSNEDAAIRSELSAAVHNPPCEGETNIVAAITAAQDELRSERANPENIPAIIFLTDGAPTTGGSTDAIARLLDELGDVRFYSVILGQDPALDQFKEFWQAEAERRPNVTFYPLSSNEEIAALYKTITTDLNGVPDPANVPLLPPGPLVRVPIPANVQQVVLTVLKPSASMPLMIQSPDGSDARALPTDRFRPLSQNSSVDVFVVRRPDAGEWTISAPGGESVTVLKPEFRSIYEVQLMQPDATSMLSADLPTQLRVQVIDSETRAAVPGTFTFTASYRPKDAAVDIAQPIALQPTADRSMYEGQIAPDTFEDGQTYLLSFMVEDSTGLRSVPSEYLIAAGRVPALTALTVAPTRAFVDESVMLKVGVSNADVAQGSVVPRLAQPLPSSVTPAFSPDGAAGYQVTLPPFSRPGTYPLTIVYGGQTTAGHSFNSTRSVTITVLEHRSTVALRWLSLVIAVMTGLYLLFHYLLLRPLIPFFQRIGVAPQGYIRIQVPNERYPDSEVDLRTVLREKRRLRKLTIGPGGDIPITLADPAADLLADDEPRVRARRGWRERVLGASSLGVIGRRLGGRTFIQGAGGAPRDFSSDHKSIEIKDNQIDFSLRSIDGPDDDGSDV